jgi:hypothetical protein
MKLILFSLLIFSTTLFAQDRETVSAKQVTLNFASTDPLSAEYKCLKSKKSDYVPFIYAGREHGEYLYLFDTPSDPKGLIRFSSAGGVYLALPESPSFSSLKKTVTYVVDRPPNAAPYFVKMIWAEDQALNKYLGGPSAEKGIQAVKAKDKGLSIEDIRKLLTEKILLSLKTIPIIYPEKPKFGDHLDVEAAFKDIEQTLCDCIGVKGVAEVIETLKEDKRLKKIFKGRNPFCLNVASI